MKKILWACQHAPTKEQINTLDGIIVELKHVNPSLFGSLSNTPASIEAIEDLALQLQLECSSYDIVVLPIGSPAFNFAFARRVPTIDNPVQYKFAYTQRVSIDEPQPDGTVRKTSIFKFEGWITFRL